MFSREWKKLIKFRGSCDDFAVSVVQILRVPKVNLLFQSCLIWETPFCLTCLSGFIFSIFFPKRSGEPTNLISIYRGTSGRMEWGVKQCFPPSLILLLPPSTYTSTRTDSLLHFKQIFTKEKYPILKLLGIQISILSLMNLDFITGICIYWIVLWNMWMVCILFRRCFLHWF